MSELDSPFSSGFSGASWGAPFSREAFDEAVKAVRNLPASPFAPLFSAPFPLYVDPKLPDDRIFLFSRPGLSLLVPERRLAMLVSTIDSEYAGEELRCGPYTTPSGKQWAVVKSRATGARHVVDWPRRVA